MNTAPQAASMPPPRQLIWLGAMLEKSNAADTKFATMLMPIVAVTNVNAPTTAANVESILLTASIGCRPARTVIGPQSTPSCPSKLRWCGSASPVQAPSI
jgi:hypothetical protein